jgi:hypothetical protein
MAHRCTEAGMAGDSKNVVRAKQGAVARWEGEAIRFAIDEGPVQLGSLTFRCAVLDDESRVINGTEFMRAMGIYRSGALSTRRSDEDGVYFPLHLAFKNLRPFILEDEELVEALRVPIRYRSVRGSVAEAIPAQVLRRICNVWVRARGAGVLGVSQVLIADKAEALLNALADVALIALIDEGTGHHKRRAHNELQRILQAYIAPELLPWQSRFPVSYYEQIYRVMGWRYDAASTRRTAYIGKLTNKLIYEKLPPGVLPQLQRKNPVDATTRRRKHKHFQFLTDDVGDVHLEKQITAVTTLLRATPDGQWPLFQSLFNHAFPPAQQDLFQGLDVQRLLIEQDAG